MARKSFAPRGRALSYRGKSFSYSGNGLKLPRINDIAAETKKAVQYVDGLVAQKPLQQLFGQKIVGDNIRQASQVIKPFSSTVKSIGKRLPLSSETLNPQNAPALVHLGKAIGSSKSLVKNVSGLFKGKGLANKNNIKLVL